MSPAGHAGSARSKSGAPERRTEELSGKRERTRKKIFEATFRLIGHERGLSVRIEEICAEAEVSGRCGERVAMHDTRGGLGLLPAHLSALPPGAARNGGFGDVTRLLDVGGGSGCFSIAIAQHLPRIRCSVMELPVVCEVAQTYIEAGGVSDRVDTVAVDMFRELWPRGYDGVLFSNVFHDWTAEDNLFLARRAYEALPSRGQVFVHEMLLAEDGSGPATTASFSILMMFGTHGRQYSRSELFKILGDAGFVDLAVRETHGYYSVLSGRKP